MRNTVKLSAVLMLFILNSCVSRHRPLYDEDGTFNGIYYLPKSRSQKYSSNMYIISIASKATRKDMPPAAASKTAHVFSVEVLPAGKSHMVSEGHEYAVYSGQTAFVELEIKKGVALVNGNAENFVAIGLLVKVGPSRNTLRYSLTPAYRPALSNEPRALDGEAIKLYGASGTVFEVTLLSRPAVNSTDAPPVKTIYYLKIERIDATR